MLEAVPEFLRGGIRGDTDAELVFHVVLSFMHDQASLSEAIVEPQAIVEAMRSTHTLLQSLAAEEGSGVVGLNWMMSGGEYVVASRRGASMATRVYRGKADADALLGDDLALRRKVPETERMYFALVASDFDVEPPPTWKRVDLGTYVVAERTSLEVIAS
jgi:glutamine amidotransferase